MTGSEVVFSWLCHLVVLSSMNDHWEAVVIGGCVAKNVHNSPDFLHSVEAGDWRAHDLSVVKTSTHK